ncbi:MAG: T9SS type A sorting domain-containing protein [Rhodothermia bacterium]|nr:T9SS type A sorting domain-containing protein [Rhodothermia bacterium]
MHLYPNPLMEFGVLAIDVGTTTTVTVDLFDVLGRRVQTLSDGFVYPGRHELTLDVSSLPAGVYFFRLRAGDRVETRSLVVAR